MPIIKNGQYATIRINEGHAGNKEEIWLTNKYYRYGLSGRPYIRYKNKNYYIEDKKKSIYCPDFDTTGESKETWESM